MTSTAARSIVRTSTEATMPLKDSFGRIHTYLRLSLTEKCSFRCIYCMPSEGVPLSPPNSLLTAKEIGRITSIFAHRGITKMRLTGGEPLIRRDIVEIAQSISTTAPTVTSLGLTTNGLVLRRHLDALLQANVQHYNISLDTLKPARFELLTRRKGLGMVIDSIHAASTDSRAKVKLNCVVMRGVNDDEVCAFAEWTKVCNIDVRFIEYMPFTGNQWHEKRFIPYNEMLARLNRKFGTLERVEDAPNDTCKHWRVSGWKGRIGFITSMSDHFCGSCNRLRITADGAIKVCLFGNDEVSLRDAIRDGANDEEVKQLIDMAVMKKKWALGGRRDRHEIASSDNRSMIRIGG